MSGRMYLYSYVWNGEREKKIHQYLLLNVFPVIFFSLMHYSQDITGNGPRLWQLHFLSKVTSGKNKFFVFFWLKPNLWIVCMLLKTFIFMNEFRPLLRTYQEVIYFDDANADRVKRKCYNSSTLSTRQYVPATNARKITSLLNGKVYIGHGIPRSRCTLFNYRNKKVGLK